MNIPDDIMEMAKVLSYQDASNSDSAPRLTGVPPHVLLMSSVDSVKGHVSDCSDGVINTIKQELDDRFIGGISTRPIRYLTKCNRSKGRCKP